MKKILVLSFAVCLMLRALPTHAQINCCPPPQIVYVEPPIREVCNNEFFILKGGIGSDATGGTTHSAHPILWDADMNFTGASGAYMGLGAHGTFTDSIIPDTLTRAQTQVVGIHLNVGYGLNRCNSRFLAGTGFGIFGGVAALNPNYSKVGFEYGGFATIDMNLIRFDSGATIGIEFMPKFIMIATPDAFNEWSYRHRGHFVLYANLKFALP